MPAGSRLPWQASSGSGGLRWTIATLTVSAYRGPLRRSAPTASSATARVRSAALRAVASERSGARSSGLRRMRSCRAVYAAVGAERDASSMDLLNVGLPSRQRRDLRASRLCPGHAGFFCLRRRGAIQVPQLNLRSRPHPETIPWLVLAPAAEEADQVEAVGAARPRAIARRGGGNVTGHHQRDRCRSASPVVRRAAKAALAARRIFTAESSG